MERIRSSAAAYKDEDTYISEHRAALVSDTRRKIDAAEKSFCDTITGEVVPALRAALVDHMTQQPDKGFMQTLTYYQQFGVLIVKATENLQAVLPDALDLKQLHLKGAKPLLEIRRRAFDVDGNVVEIRRSRVITSRHHYHIEL